MSPSRPGDSGSATGEKLWPPFVLSARRSCGLERVARVEEARGSSCRSRRRPDRPRSSQSGTPTGSIALIQVPPPSELRARRMPGVRAEEASGPRSREHAPGDARVDRERGARLVVRGPHGHGRPDGGGAAARRRRSRRSRDRDPASRCCRPRPRAGCRRGSRGRSGRRTWSAPDRRGGPTCPALIRKSDGAAVCDAADPDMKTASTRVSATLRNDNRGLRAAPPMARSFSSTNARLELVTKAAVGFVIVGVGAGGRWGDATRSSAPRPDCPGGPVAS